MRMLEIFAFFEHTEFRVTLKTAALIECIIGLDLSSTELSKLCAKHIIKFQGAYEFLRKNQNRYYVGSELAKLYMVNDLLCGYGIQGFATSCTSGFTYIITGDAYSRTVLLDENNTLQLTSWGDYYESTEHYQEQLELENYIIENEN